MADLALVTANTVHIVETIEQFTIPVEEALTAGMAARLNTTSGKLTKSNATTTTENRVLGIGVATVQAGQALTILAKGVLDGYDLSGLAYDAPVYLSDTDGKLATAAGTTSKVVGRVIPGTAVGLGSAYDKLLRIEL